jgi:hypothetical protein
MMAYCVEAGVGQQFTTPSDFFLQAAWSNGLYPTYHESVALLD